MLNIKRSAAVQSLGLGDETKQQLADDLDERKKKMMRAASVAGFAPVGAASSLLGTSGGMGFGSAY